MRWRKEVEVDSGIFNLDLQTSAFNLDLGLSRSSPA